MTSKCKLDFAIIGAQKSGTTTLFRYLQQHPSIFMPKGKEVPFFSDPRRQEMGWEVYMRDEFALADARLLWGTATPQYMTDTRVATEIKLKLPEIKIIAILREPIDRAFSHYRMAVRRGVESRAFSVAVESQLSRANWKINRESKNEMNCYVAWGEYGRLLSPYFDQFARNQILALSFRDLMSRPVELLGRIHAFLNVESLTPNDVGRVYHRGGTREKLPIVRKIRAIAPIKRVWKMLPQSTRSTFMYWFEQWNTVPEAASPPTLSSELHSALQSHFYDDYVSHGLAGLGVENYLLK